VGLNKLDNFIKNTEGRILYVNPSDLDSSDAVDNQGNSLARPFKTIQRAIIEAARFSYVRGNNNDLVEKTTILLFPGEYSIDNRPGYAIYNDNGVARAVSPGGVEYVANQELSLDLDSIFDLTQEDNILYKFNSINGGVIVPRGCSIVGLDLRKTKIRAKYIPNPTDNSPKTAIFRLTGACYLWQMSFFDGDETGLVYTSPNNFSDTNKSIPLFSHHKLTCFEYADGVNEVGSYGLTDLDMYYSKVSNAFNAYREITTLEKYPQNPDAFSKRDPEWQIVGAFASDPISIDSIISGDGVTASSLITVTTELAHNLNEGTPIKIRNVGVNNYNISSKVQNVLSPTQFTYLLPTFPNNLNPNPNVASATVTVETDTVSGASPYIFNCSLRSVWGMNGIHADGSKASGFRSMVTAQFTGVSLQKDDRAFAKYDSSSRTYNKVTILPVFGSELPLGASQTNTDKVYHLDPEAIYRNGWESSHIKISNDAFIQVVSVFAIGFTKHFDAESGGDFSITNSNSNFGQFALSSTGFKREAFEKDDKSFITSIVVPKAVDINTEESVFWIPIDVGITTQIGNQNRLYLNGYDDQSNPPTSIIQGYAIGARISDKLYLKDSNGVEKNAEIVMGDDTTSSKKEYSVTTLTSNIFTLPTHRIETGEKVVIRSSTGDLPEGLETKTTYYAIKISNTQIKLASTFADSQIGKEIATNGGSSLKIISTVSGKSSGEIGSPIQFDTSAENWYINVKSGSTLYSYINTLNQNDVPVTSPPYIKRIGDDRSIDEKLYKLRVSIPKEFENAKDPESGFVIQDSSTITLEDVQLTTSSITNENYDYKRNPRLISGCTFSSNTVTVTTETPHNLRVGDIVTIKNVQSSNNPTGELNKGYNGSFTVATVSSTNNLVFTYSSTDVDGVVHTIVGNSTNNTSIRTIENIGRVERRDNQQNVYIYRNEITSKYKQNIQDGVYLVYPLNASNKVQQEFTTTYYSQNPTDLYPQLDRDNVDDNPYPTATYAKRSPLGDVETSEIRHSLTRESINKLLIASGQLLDITSVSSSASSFTIVLDRPHGLSSTNNIGDIIQITGSNTKTDTYHRITSLPATNQIVITRSSGESLITNTQFALIVARSTPISTGSGSGTVTITCSESHGLSVGHKVTLINSSNNRVGEYIVRTVPNVTTFTISTSSSISVSGGYVLKNGLSSTNGSIENSEKDFSVRNFTFYGRDNLKLNAAITSTTSSSIGATVLTGTSILTRFKVGDYIQIDDEIMRIAGSGSGTTSTTFTVIRGVFGTRANTHLINSLIRKISPLAIEFRRPSVIRASGHTFEYLGFGPGNYSTALPQVQLRTLSDRESFLANSQEKSCGIVVYNGINNNGDVFFGNTKTSASSGEVISYDIPKPSVLGQQESSNIAIFDEVTIKQRLLVEGGSSGTILSQFDGPVTFTNDVKIRGDLNLEGNLNVTTPDDRPIVISGDYEITGDLEVQGGTTLDGEVIVNTGIVPDADEGAYIGTPALPFSEAHIGEIRIADTDDNTIDTATGNLVLSATDEISIQKNTTITGNLTVEGTINSDFSISSPSISPVGTIVLWPSNTEPENWKLCNGAAISRQEYSTLYNKIGETYGSGNGSTTFNLPDLRDLFVAGAGRNYNLGGTGGADTVTLVTANMPIHNHSGSTIDENGSHSHTVTGGSHNHGGSTGNNSVDHSHGVSIPYDTRNENLTNSGNVLVHKSGPTGPTNTDFKTYTTGGASSTHTHSISSESHTHDVNQQGTHSHTFKIESEGSNEAHENRPPFIALHYIIRVL